MNFTIRDVFKCEDGRRIRIIDKFDEDSERLIVTIDVHAKDAQPQIWTPEEISGIAKQQGWTRDKGSASPVVRQEVSEKAKALRQERFSIAKDFAKDKRFYRMDTRSQAVAEWAERFNKSPAYIRKLLRAYFQGGMTPDALETKFHQCGRHAFDGKPRGRKPKYLEYEPFVWAEEQHQQAVKFCVEKYQEDVTVSYEEVHEKLLKKYYTYVAQDGAIVLLQPGQRPSRRQIETLIKKNTTLKGLRESRLSLAHYQNNEAPKLGTVLQDCGGPGDVYEIDASQVDVWLVSALNKSLLIGKATVYLIVDRFSRLIVGFYLSLDAPSWSSARRAILSVVQDKKKLCEDLGVPYDQADWPAHGMLPNRFVADNGEMASGGSDSIADETGIEITNLPSLMSSCKGMVECAFKLVHIPFKRMRAGWEPARNVKRRRGKKYHNDGTMTFEQLKSKFLRIVISHNKRVMKGYLLPPEDIAQGCVPRPLDVFNRGINLNLGFGRSYQEEEVLLGLLERGQGTVRQTGIRVGKLYYTCAEAEEAQWFTSAAVHGAFDVEVRVDAGLVDHIYVFDPNNKANFYRAELTPKLQCFRGYSRAEVEQMMYRYKKGIAEANELDLLRNILEMHKDEEAGLLPHSNRPKLSKTKGPAARRQDQLSARSNDKAFSATRAEADVVNVEVKEVPSESTSTESAVASQAAPVINPAPKAPVRTAAQKSLTNQYFKNDDDLE